MQGPPDMHVWWLLIATGRWQDSPRSAADPARSRMTQGRAERPRLDRARLHLNPAGAHAERPPARRADHDQLLSMIRSQAGPAIQIADSGWSVAESIRRAAARSTPRKALRSDASRLAVAAWLPGVRT